MKTRWLAGTLLFAFGFGSALLVRLPSADASSTQGVVDGTLKYIDGEDAFELIYPPGETTDYFVVAARDPEAAQQPGVTYKTGGATFSKKGLRSLTVLRLTPLIVWKEDQDTLRCGNFPVLCVLPPPPPPPIQYDYSIVKSAP